MVLHVSTPWVCGLGRRWHVGPALFRLRAGYLPFLGRASVRRLTLLRVTYITQRQYALGPGPMGRGQNDSMLRAQVLWEVVDQPYGSLPGVGLPSHGEAGSVTQLLRVTPMPPNDHEFHVI